MLLMIDPKRDGRGSHKIYLMAMTGCFEEPHGRVYREKTRRKIKSCHTQVYGGGYPSLPATFLGNLRASFYYFGLWIDSPEVDIGTAPLTQG